MMKFSLPSDRVPFVPIVDRPMWHLPDGNRLLVWIIVNVEHWTMANPMPRSVLSPPMGQPMQPDVPLPSAVPAAASHIPLCTEHTHS